MISQGRALAVAAVWIVLPLGCAALALILWAAGSDNEFDALVIALAVGGVVVLTPLSLLASAVWIARRGSKARSVAALGAQAGLIGLTVAGLAVAFYIASHWK